MTKPKRKQPLGQTIGGVLFGFEQQIVRNQPPPHELVHHARPDDPVPAGDGGFVTIDVPGALPPLEARIRDQGREAAGPPWESTPHNPDVAAPGAVRTEVIRPVRGGPAS